MNPKIGQTVVLDETCFKIDRANGLAMIYGFKNDLNNEKIRQAIYCITNQSIPNANYFNDQVNIAKLITYHTGQNIPFGDELSKFGEIFTSKANPQDYQYIAICDTLYQIKNSTDLWKLICYSGSKENLFGIWKDSAPFNRFNGKNEPFFIALLRIFKITKILNNNSLIPNAVGRNPSVVRPEFRNVIIENAVLSDDKFSKLKFELEESLAKYLTGTKIIHINNTLEGYNENEPIRIIDNQVKTAENEIDKYCNLLKECKPQIILQGAPGTGKTYTAEKIAKKLTENSTGEYKIIQFHPAYSYEDFVRGIVAKTINNAIAYEVEDKILLEFVEKANKEKDKKFVLILDEINRANLPAVLGELIFAMEYREKFVDCLYKKGNNNKIKLPENLFFIGTMNTADRSVGTIDYAIRRRFAFVTLTADREIIRNMFTATYKKAVSLFDQVENLFINIAPDYNKDDVMIGHSYFLADTLNKLELKLEYEIKPILREYVKDGVLNDKNGIKIIDEINKLTLTL